MAETPLAPLRSDRKLELRSNRGRDESPPGAVCSDRTAVAATIGGPGPDADDGPNPNGDGALDDFSYAASDAFSLAHSAFAAPSSFAMRAASASFRYVSRLAS